MASPSYAVNQQNIDKFISSLATNGEAKQLLQNYIEDLPAFQAGGNVTVGDFSGATHNLQDLGTAKVGIIEPNSDIVMTSDHDAAFEVLSNSSVDFSNSQAPDGSPVALNIIVGDGNNHIFLNNGADLVQGTDGNDTITSDQGNDTIVAGSGNSSIQGGGHSLIEGGSGSATLEGGLYSSSRDTIYGGTGSQVIKVSHGNNEIHGGTGPETITAGSGHDTIYGGPGAETINGGIKTTIYGGGQSQITAGDQDTIKLTGSDTLFGGANANSVTTAENSHTSIQGGDGKLDVNLSTSGGANDSIFGGMGGITVHVGEQYGQLLTDNTKDQSGATIVKFTNGQELHVSHVTIEFPDGKHTLSF